MKLYDLKSTQKYPFTFFLICSTLNPHKGWWGEWSDYKHTSCNGDFMNGVAFRAEGSRTDDRAATNLRMHCAGGKWVAGANTDKERLLMSYKITLIYNNLSV